MMKIRGMSIITTMIGMFLLGTAYAAPGAHEPVSPDTRAGDTSISALFYEANKYYEQGDFEKALAEYQKIRQAGYDSGALYYNRGNTYYKLGKIGAARLNYERAARLMPHDEDLFANEKLVRSLIREEDPQETYPWYVQMLVVIRDSMPAGVWFVISLIVYGLLVLAGVGLIFVPRLRASVVLWVLAGICGLLVFSFTAAAIHHEAVYHAGIILEPEVAVRYSPSYEGALAFKIHEGIKVGIVRRQGDWVQVRLGKGKSGWVERTAVEEI